MANINAALPTAIAIPFHPAAESLHRENLIRPVIPKTEVIASYAKFRESEEHDQFSAQAREFVQGENEQQRSNDNNSEQQQSTSERRRFNFFANRAEIEEEHDSKALVSAGDVKLSRSIIQDKYHHAVSPIADPTINYFI